MIERATSIQFKKQVQGTFNRPIISLCRTRNGIETYFLKYPRINNEFYGLFSEIICNKLAKRCDLNTPEIAIVEIGNHPIDSNKITHHRKLSSGQKVFGSRKLTKVDELSRLNFVVNKHDFNRLRNPSNILKIGLFDLWIANSDRKEDNYNVFLSQTKQQKLYIFDHFEAFNRIANNVQKDIPLNVDVFNGFLGTSFAYNMLRWVKDNELYQILDDFLITIDSFDIPDLINTVSKNLPTDWKIKDKSLNYISGILTSEERIGKIEEQIKDYIKYLPSK